MEKNKQILEFGDIMKESDSYVPEYRIIRSMFIEFVEYIGMSWNEFKNIKTKEEIIDEYKNFILNYYLPF